MVAESYPFQVVHPEYLTRYAEIVEQSVGKGPADGDVACRHQGGQAQGNPRRAIIAHLSLITSIISNVLDVSLKSECDNLKIGHEFQEPFGDDIAEALENIIKSLDGGIMATETGVELNPLVKDKKLEMERLKAEEEERAQKQQQIFGDIEGAGPQSASDGDDAPDDNENGDEDDPKKKQQQKQKK